MRSRLRFLYPGIPGCLLTWKFRSILSNSCVQPSRSARNQGHESLIAWGTIHQGHERLSDNSRRRHEQFLPIREWRCQHIDEVLLHGDHFFFSLHSAAVNC